MPTSSVSRATTVGMSAATRARRGKALLLPQQVITSPATHTGYRIDGLLGQLKIRREYTAVALNREVWPKSRYAETVLKDGDRVEIVRPMGGG